MAVKQINGLEQITGVPITEASVDLTAQTAAIVTTTLFTLPAANGEYNVNWNAKVTTAAGTTSTLGGLTINWTDPDGVAQTILAPATHSSSPTTLVQSDNGNTTTTYLLGMSLLLNCKASTVIQYAFAYASNPANAMNYNLHIRLQQR